MNKFNENGLKNIKVGLELLSEREALSRALICHKAGDFKSAEKIYRDIYIENPRCADAPYLSGLILYHFGVMPTAIYALRRAIALDDSRSHYHYNLGVILLDDGKIIEAKECFQKALALDSHYTLARDMLEESEKKLETL